jgi:predicted nuclease of predicted toxin-antitoxin system
VKFLADENFPLPALVALRNLGYDVSSIAEDHAGSPDETVAGICDREGRILLTFDKDFGEMVFRRGMPVGSCVVLFRISPEAAAVVEVIRSLIDRGDLIVGAFCVVARDRVRVRFPGAAG